MRKNEDAVRARVPERRLSSSLGDSFSLFGELKLGLFVQAIYSIRMPILISLNRLCGNEKLYLKELLNGCLPT